MGFINRVENRADLKCEGKHPSEGDKLTIDAIGVTRMSLQSFTKLVNFPTLLLLLLLLFARTVPPG